MLTIALNYKFRIAWREFAMEKKLKITFERGGIFYARFLSKEAPKTVNLIDSTLPFQAKILHGRYAGPAIFYDTGFGTVEKENSLVDKSIGALTLTMGTSRYSGKAVHIFYDKDVASSKEENWFANIDENLAELKIVGERIWKEGPEKATFESWEG